MGFCFVLLAAESLHVDFGGEHFWRGRTRERRGVRGKKINFMEVNLLFVNFLIIMVKINLFNLE